MEVEFDIDADEVIQKFTQLERDTDPRTAARIWKKAMRNAAKPIVKDAKRRVPKRTAKERKRAGVSRKGNLRSSVGMKVGARKSRRMSRKSNQYFVAIGYRRPPGYHGHFIEFGFDHRSGYRATAQYPLRHAMRAKRNTFWTRMQIHIRRLLEA